MKTMHDKKLDEFTTITEIIDDLKTKMAHFEMSLTRLINRTQYLFTALEEENRKLRIENERLKNAVGG